MKGKENCEESAEKNLYHAFLEKEEDVKSWEKDVDESDEIQERIVPEIFSEFITSWDCDGAMRFHGPLSIRRTIWTIFWSIMLCLGAYQCYTTYKEYQKFEKIVSIEYVDPDFLEFPAVTFCTLNPFSPNSDSWYANNTNWKGFWDLQDRYSKQPTPDQCSNFGDSTSTNQNSTRSKRSETGEDDRSKLYQLPAINSSVFEELGLMRKRRAATLLQEPTTFINASASDILNSRIKCSLVFQRLLVQYNLANGIDLPNLVLPTTSSCQNLSTFQNKQKLWFDHVCKTPVVQDIYGYYSSNTNPCVPVVEDSIANKVCSTCCPEVVNPCLSKDEYVIKEAVINKNDTSIDQLSYLITSISRTPDGIDIIDKFSPSQDEIDSSSAPVNDIILTCSFDLKKCTSKDFQVWKHYEYGRCYTFNSAFVVNNTTAKPIVRSTYFYGPKYGLHITLDIKSKYILDILSPEIGLKVVLHKPDTMPFPEDEGINVLPGVSSFIQFRPSEIKRIGAPWGKCAKVPWTTQYNYTKTACQKVCLEQQYRNVCNCYVGMSPAYSFLPMPSNLHKCSGFNITQKFCMDNIIFRNQQLGYECNCPLSCNEWNYSPRVTYSLTNQKYYKIVQAIKGKNLGEDICSGSNNSTIRMVVYMDQLSHSLFTEKEAFSMETLVSNIGSNMSFFVGVSIISCLELLEFLFNVFLHYIQKVRNKPKNNQPVERIRLYLVHEHCGDEDFRNPNGKQQPVFISSLDASTLNFDSLKRRGPLQSKMPNPEGDLNKKTVKVDKKMSDILFSHSENTWAFSS